MGMQMCGAVMLDGSRAPTEQGSHTLEKKKQDIISQGNKTNDPKQECLQVRNLHTRFT